ncbi:hypothetical protein DSECCO2_416280 [anaerobic digester metagenome]
MNLKTIKELVARKNSNPKTEVSIDENSLSKEMEKLRDKIRADQIDYKKLNQDLESQLENNFRGNSTETNSKIKIETVVNVVFSTINVVSFFIKFKEMVDFATKIDPVLGPYMNLVGEYQLIPSPQYDIELMRRLTRIYNSDIPDKKEKILSEYLNNYGNNYISGIRSQWGRNSLLANRSNILDQILQAHMLELYCVSTPVALSQIESIIAEWFSLPNQNRYKAFEHIVNMWVGEANYYDELVSRFISEVLLVNFSEGEPINSDMSRHAIEHGYDLKYGTKINSLRAIQVLEYLIKKTSFISKTDENKFHKIGCRKMYNEYYSNPKGKKVYNRPPEYTFKRYDSMRQAINDGKEPCEECCKLQ